MSNKINGIDNRPAPVTAGQPVRRPQEPTTGAKGSTPQQAAPGVQITESARQLAALEQALKAMPAVNEAKVAEIRKAIEEGRYKVSPERIADKLLQIESEITQVMPSRE